MDGFKMDDCTIAVTYKCKKKNKNKNSFFKLEDRRKSGRGGPTSNDICYNCGK